MVMRKPVPAPLATANTPQQPAPPQAAPQQPAPPYPTTPPADQAAPGSRAYTATSTKHAPDLGTSPACDIVDGSDAQQGRSRSNSDASHNTWDSDSADEATPEEHAIPKPLRITPSKQNITAAAQRQDGEGTGDGGLPAALRPGPPGGARPSSGAVELDANPWAVREQRTADAGVGGKGSHNPYLRSQPTGQNAWDESSNAIWGDVPPRAAPPPSATAPPPPAAAPPPPAAAPPAPPVELPTMHTPADEMSQMSLSSSIPLPQQERLLVDEQQSGGSASSNAWQQVPTPAEKWGDTNHALEPFPPPPPKSPRRSQDFQYAPPPPPKSPRRSREFQYAPPPGISPRQQQPQLVRDKAPSLPPYTSIEEAPACTAPKPAPIATSQPSTAYSSETVPETVPETPTAQAKRQRGEHYQIKHINWADTSYASDPRHKSPMRRSPILTQNTNGPCPLLALVNALVLSTPQNVDTALIETLRTREQVSFGLLLDAVFDELMSGRRGDSAQELPDVSELYAFLLALHTGMNVNPRFVTPAVAPRGSVDGHPPNLNGTHPLHSAQSKAGCFEDTREMRLYSTFNVPLIHGWTCPNESPAYAAFERSAKTFEDAQNIQFAEVELEDKLRTEGLGADEQQSLQDIQTIKQFLANWPTQLTEHGLNAISTSLQPAQIAILFRNDHFSTLYKEPKSGALMTLVTDTGYSSHDEIVWESLVDVNGAASELFSGDFRAVSHGNDVRVQAPERDGWETVPSHSRHKTHNANNNNALLQATNNNSNANTSDDTPPPLPGPRPRHQASSSGSTVLHPPAPALAPAAARLAAEQQDHDLALALQLQDEEEASQRQSSAQRRREAELSEQFLERERPPAIPPRRHANPAVHRPSPNSAADAPPPSYEQAAADRPYRPSGATAPLPTRQGDALTAYDALRRQQSAYTQQNGTVGVQGRRGGRSEGFRGGRRGASSVVAQQMQRLQAQRVEDERCALM